jgi:hypothetical protein
MSIFGQCARLFVSCRDHRIDARGPARRQRASEELDAHQSRQPAGTPERVARALQAILLPMRPAKLSTAVTRRSA